MTVSSRAKACRHPKADVVVVTESSKRCGKCGAQRQAEWWGR